MEVAEDTYRYKDNQFSLSFSVSNVDISRTLGYLRTVIMLMHLVHELLLVLGL